MALLEKIRDIETRAKKVADQAVDAEKYQKLHQLRQNLVEKMGPIDKGKKRWRTLNKVGITMTLSTTQASRLVEKIEKMKTSLQDEATLDRLTRGRDWQNLLDSIDTYSEELTLIITEKWTEYKRTELNFEKITNITAPKTRENKALLKQYEGYHGELGTKIQTIPESTDVLADINKLKKKLDEVLSGLNRDLPKEVETFLNLLDRGTATLDDFSDEVRDWLKKNDDLTMLRISRSS